LKKCTLRGSKFEKGFVDGRPVFPSDPFFNG